MQIRRYLDNKDTSSFSTKEFNMSPLDLYPSFTYCFEDHKGGLYDKRNFTEVTGLTREEYQKVLMGKKELFNDKSDDKMPNVYKMDANIVTLKENDIFYTMESHFLNHSKQQKERSGAVWTHDFPRIYKSYQDPIKVCFTRKSVFEDGIVRQSDYLTTLAAKRLANILNMKTRLLFYIHQDQQLIRAFKNVPVYSYYLKKDVWPLYPVDRFLLINIVRVSVLRKRPDAINPCNPNLDDDDNEFRDQAISLVGCIPPFWTQFQHDQSVFGPCNTTVQLMDMFDRITNYQTILDNYLPPCNEMSIVPTLSIKGATSKGNGVEIWYMDKRYEEATNRRDFGFEMFWSSIGGFTGIFLGFSLLQIPDLVVNFISKTNKSSKNKKRLSNIT